MPDIDFSVIDRIGLEHTAGLISKEEMHFRTTLESKRLMSSWGPDTAKLLKHIDEHFEIHKAEQQKQKDDLLDAFRDYCHARFFGEKLRIANAFDFKFDDEESKKTLDFVGVKSSRAHLFFDAQHGIRAGLRGDEFTFGVHQVGEALDAYWRGRALQELKQPIDNDAMQAILAVEEFLACRDEEERPRHGNLIPNTFLPRHDFRAMLDDFADERSTEVDIPDGSALFEFQFCSVHLGVFVEKHPEGINRVIAEWCGDYWRAIIIGRVDSISQAVECRRIETEEPDPDSGPQKFFAHVMRFVESELEILSSSNFIEIVEESQPLPVSRKEARKLRNMGKPLPAVTYKVLKINPGKAYTYKEYNETDRHVRLHWRRTHFWPRDPHDLRRHKRAGRWVGEINLGVIHKRYAIPVLEDAEREAAFHRLAKKESPRD